MRTGKFRKPIVWALSVITVLTFAAAIVIYFQRRPAAELREAKEMLTDFHKYCAFNAQVGSGILFETMDGLVRKTRVDQATSGLWWRLIEVEPRGLTQSDEGQLPLAWTRWRGKWVVVTVCGSLEVMDDATLKKRREWE